RWIDLRESEVRMLATAGAFRVVVASDLRDHHGRPASASNGELRGLREAGLVETRPYVIGQDRAALVTLTDRGRELLERHRRTDREVRSQTYYAGFVKPRELSHDAQLYRAYERSAERLKEKGAVVTRVVLDYELKRDYQRFLHDLKRERRGQEQDADRHAADVAEWAASRDLPVIDGHVHFPDVRIEYERPDGDRKVGPASARTASAPVSEAAAGGPAAAPTRASSRSSCDPRGARQARRKLRLHASAGRLHIRSNAALWFFAGAAVLLVRAHRPRTEDGRLPREVDHAEVRDTVSLRPQQGSRLPPPQHDSVRRHR